MSFLFNTEPHTGEITDMNGTIKNIQDKEFYFQRQNKGTRLILPPETNKM